MDTLEYLLDLARHHPEKLALVAGGVWRLFWIEGRRSRGMISDWCDSHGYRLIRARRRHGPFGAFPMASDNQSVWRIVAEDVKLGGKRRGWARCGGYWRGLASGEVAVEWEFTAQELSDGRDLPGARTG